MAFSLYDASVANYLQTLGAVAGILDRSLTHFREKGIDPETIVEARLAPDMLPFRFQIISVAQHSRGAIEGVQQGLFNPPSFKTPVLFSVSASAPTAMPPCSCSAAPDATVVPPAVVPSAVAFWRFCAPADTVVVPV